MITQLGFNNVVTPLGGSSGTDINTSRMENTLNVVNDKVGILINQSEYKNGYNDIFTILNTSNVSISGNNATDIINTIQNLSEGYSNIAQTLIDKGVQVFSNDPVDIARAVSKISPSTDDFIDTSDGYPVIDLSIMHHYYWMKAALSAGEEILSGNNMITVSNVKINKQYWYVNAVTNVNSYPISDTKSRVYLGYDNIYWATTSFNMNMTSSSYTNNVFICTNNHKYIFVSNAANLFSGISLNNDKGVFPTTSFYNVIKFNKCINFAYLFDNSAVLSSRVLGIFNNIQTHNGKYFQYAFNSYNDNALTLNCEKDINVSNAVNMSHMFYNARVNKVILNNVSTLKLKDTSYMFAGINYTFTKLLSGWNTSSVTNMVGMFYGSSIYNDVGLQYLNTYSVTNMHMMFESSRITSTRIGNGFDQWDTSSVYDMSRMFYDSSIGNNTNINIQLLNVISVRNMSEMFTNINDNNGVIFKNNSFVGFNGYAPNVINMYGMFNNCRTLKTIDLSLFDFSNVSNLVNIFCNCKSLTTIYYNPDNFKLTLGVDSTDAFLNCTKLVGPGGAYDATKTNITSETIARYFTPI